MLGNELIRGSSIYRKSCTDHLSPTLRNWIKKIVPFSIVFYKRTQQFDWRERYTEDELKIAKKMKATSGASIDLFINLHECIRQR